jgi:hypothetical protein
MNSILLMGPPSFVGGGPPCGSPNGTCVPLDNGIILLASLGLILIFIKLKKKYNGKKMASGDFNAR